VELGREVLDQQLVDMNGLNMGKVDGIVLELREGMPPRVAAVLTGGHLFARRLHPRLAHWARRIAETWGPGALEPLRIPWSRVKKIGVDVKVEAPAERGMPWECWVRDHIIRHIPGA
jgi:sporulation protein YlmC with PRC-barrel domain